MMASSSCLEDDNEMHRLRTLMDEVFGEDNFVGTIIWRNVTDNNPTNISVEHEYVTCYAASHESLESSWHAGDFAREESANGNRKGVSSQRIPIKMNAKPRIRSGSADNRSQLRPLDRYKYIDADGIFYGQSERSQPR